MIVVLKDEYYAWHLLPTTQLAKETRVGLDCPVDKPELSEQVIQDIINERYYKIAGYPLIERNLSEKYGGDISNIIMNYFDRMDISATECFIERSLDDLFGFFISDIILEYYR